MTSVLLHDDDANIKMSYKKKTKKKCMYMSFLPKSSSHIEPRFKNNKNIIKLTFRFLRKKEKTTKIPPF